MNYKKGLRKTHCLPLIVLLSVCCSLSAQHINYNLPISISDDGSVPDNSAILDLSNDAKGILIPRMTMAQRNAIVQPARSLLIFQTDNMTGFYYNAGNSTSPDWQPISNGASLVSAMEDADGDTGVKLIEGTSDKIEFEVDNKTDVTIEIDDQSNGAIHVGDGSAYSIGLNSDRLNFKGFGTEDVDANIRNLNGQLFIQSFKENFGLSLIGKDQIIMQVSGETGAFFQMHDDASFQIGLGSQSFGKQAKLDIYHASSSISPHLNLIENEPGKSSRLRFKNDNAPLLDWSIAAKLEDDAEVFGMYLNGSEMMTYKADEDVWNFNRPIKVISDDLVINPDGSQDGAQIFLKNSTGSDRVKLFAQPSAANEGGWISLFNGSDTRTILLQAEDNQDGGRIHIAKADGAENLKLDSNWNGTGFSRVVTDELELNGGADFAEYFNIVSIDGDLMPGTVVSIDASESGKLVKSAHSYDPKVAGIISGANGVRPGLMMGQDNSIADGEYPVALSGRVYVRANAESGDIRPGDLLTTSSTPGEAMKAKDKARSYGSIIGKAMTSEDENGFVLVLVTLQ